MAEHYHSDEEEHPDPASMDYSQPTGSESVTNNIEACQRLLNGALIISQVVYIDLLHNTHTKSSPRLLLPSDRDTTCGTIDHQLEACLHTRLEHRRNEQVRSSRHHRLWYHDTR